jgi:hypothetical protein
MKHPFKLETSFLAALGGAGQTPIGINVWTNIAI